MGAIRRRKNRARRKSLRERCVARRWRRAGYGHTNFALVVAAWKRKKKQRRKRPYLSGSGGTGRRRRSSASSRGDGTTWSSKCGRCSPKGGTTTGRGTPREARGNAHHPTNPARRTAARRGAARRSIRAGKPNGRLPPVNSNLPEDLFSAVRE